MTIETKNAVNTPAIETKFEVGKTYAGKSERGSMTCDIKVTVVKRTAKCIFWVAENMTNTGPFRTKIKSDGTTEFISDNCGRCAKASDIINEPATDEVKADDAPETVPTLTELENKVADLRAERDQVAAYVYNSDDRKRYNELHSAKDMLLLLAKVDSPEDKAIAAQIKPLSEKLIATENKLNQLDAEIATLDNNITALKEVESATTRAAYYAYLDKLAARLYNCNKGGDTDGGTRHNALRHANSFSRPQPEGHD